MVRVVLHGERHAYAEILQPHIDASKRASQQIAVFLHQREDIAHHTQFFVNPAIFISRLIGSKRVMFATRG